MKYVIYLESGEIETVGEAPDSYIPMLQGIYPRFLRYSPLDSELYVQPPEPPVEPPVEEPPVEGGE